MKCGVCKGQLVWDYERGEVVCTRCGLIVDQLTTLELEGYRTFTDIEEKCVSKKLCSRSVHVTSSKYKYMLKLYKECRRITENKPWLEVDYNKVFKTGKLVMSIRSKASIEAFKNIEVLGYWDILKKGLEFIDSVNPAFLARSERSRYALAYIVARKLETGKYPTCEEVTSIFNVSTTSYKRLCTLANKLITTANKLHMNRLT